MKYENKIWASPDCQPLGRIIPLRLLNWGPPAYQTGALTISGLGLKNLDFSPRLAELLAQKDAE